MGALRTSILATVRFWAVVDAPALTAAQGALASLGPDWEGSPSTPYAEPPAYEEINVYWDGWQIEEALAVQAEALLGSVTGVRTWRGPVYGLEDDDSPGILQAADALTEFPEPDSGPSATTKVSRLCALALAYRDFEHGTLPVELVAAPTR